MYFVRHPRAPEDPGELHTKGIENEMEAYQVQMRVLNESINLKKMERDSAKDARNAAQEALNACRAACNSKDAEILPLRELRKQQREGRNAVRSLFDDLDVTSEAELDARLCELNHRMAHESNTVAEEKKMIALMKKLEAQREKVVAADTKRQHLTVTASDAANWQARLAELEAERTALQAELETQLAIRNRCKDSEVALNQGVEDAMAERKRVKELSDAAYGRLQAMRRDKRARNGPFQDNRRFSAQVRDLVRDDHAEEARAKCEKQVDAELARLAAEPELRKEYYALWDVQRKYAFWQADDEPHAAPALPKGRQAAAAPPAAAQRTPQDIIAEALREAQEEASAKKRATAAATASKAPGAASTSSAAPPPAENGGAPPQAAAPAGPRAPAVPVPGATAVAAGDAAADRARAARRRAKEAAEAAAARAAVALPDLGRDEPFVPPTAVLKTEVRVSEEEAKTRAREHNAAAAREAEARRKRAVDKKARLADAKARSATEARAQTARPPREAAQANGGPAVPEAPEADKLAADEDMALASVSAPEPAPLPKATPTPAAPLAKKAKSVAVPKARNMGKAKKGWQRHLPRSRGDRIALAGVLAVALAVLLWLAYIYVLPLLTLSKAKGSATRTVDEI
ncbi:hypothetical protein WJX81_005857 [Elliptochloris bilobata]|uniref:Proton pump-interactor 1 n=1 Tax=Elliptochloris bilobata TaxID=381761 RepID=A0AAW1RGP4_9CHLO